MSEPLGIAIVGPGKVAQTHAEAVAALPEARLVAVGGRNGERTAAFAGQFGARSYTDLAALLGDREVDAVIICTPHPSHAALGIAAAEAGKHVLVEKPLAITASDCDRMIAAAARCGVQLGVISQRRLYPPVARMREAIDAGKIGQPVLGTVTVLGWRSPEYYEMDPWRGTWDGEGGGVLVNQAVHQLDLFLWLMGPAEEVFGYWANLNHPTIEVEDTAVAVIRFQSGALGNIVVSNSQNPGLYGNIRVHGANGASLGVQTDGGSMFIAGVTAAVEPPYNDIWTVPGETEQLAGWQASDRALAGEIDIQSHFHRVQIADFVAAVRERRPPMVPGAEGRGAVALFEAIYRAQREGRPIRIAELGAAALR